MRNLSIGLTCTALGLIATAAVPTTAVRAQTACLPELSPENPPQPDDDDCDEVGNPDEGGNPNTGGGPPYPCTPSGVPC